MSLRYKPEILEDLRALRRAEDIQTSSLNPATPVHEAKREAYDAAIAVVETLYDPWRCPEEFLVDTHDPELLEPVADRLRHVEGIPAFVENTGGGCYCIAVYGADGYQILTTPSEEDGRHWWISFDAPDAEYLGMFTTEGIGPWNRLPTTVEIVAQIAPIINRLHGKKFLDSFGKTVDRNRAS